MIMDFIRAFTYITDDKRWLAKLGETAVFALLCPLPVIGLISLCALLGYLAELIHNVGNDYPRPLPEWDHIGEDISKGLPVLVALIIYHLPLLLAMLFLYAFRHVIAVSLFGGITFLSILGGLAPLLILYFALAWSLLALGLARYAESWESDSFYHVNRSLRSLQKHSTLALQWLIASLAASIILLALLPAALLGLVLFVPVQGYLTGSYARKLRAERMALRRGRARAADAARWVLPRRTGAQRAEAKNASDLMDARNGMEERLAHGAQVRAESCVGAAFTGYN